MHGVYHCLSEASDAGYEGDGHLCCPPHLEVTGIVLANAPFYIVYMENGIAGRKHGSSVFQIV